jgi:probable DNA metabolism protein
VVNRLTDETVHALITAVRHLNHEAHLFSGFIRFSEVSGALVAQIEPKNIVLPLIAPHFCERYPCEKFLIYDRTHGMALIYQDKKASICDADAFEQPEAGEEERQFRKLWRLFYDTIEIKERRNPRCRMSHMPKRYWNCMTEFARETTQKESKGLTDCHALPSGANDV